MKIRQYDPKATYKVGDMVTTEDCLYVCCNECSQSFSPIMAPLQMLKHRKNSELPELSETVNTRYHFTPKQYFTNEFVWIVISMLAFCAGLIQGVNL